MYQDLKDKIKKNLPSSSFWTVAGFILILCLSWFYFSQPSWKNQEEQIHSLLQNQFQTLISDFVAKKHPEVDKITFHKVWTKNSKDPNLIKIIFSYSLWTTGELGGDHLIEGSAQLKRSEERETLWIVQNFQITDSLMDFSEPLLIKADAVAKDL